MRIYLTIIPRGCVGYELAIIISYPTSASGIIIVLLKMPTKSLPLFTCHKSIKTVNARTDSTGLDE